MTTNDTRIPAARLAAFITRALTAAGLPATDAETVAGLMVEADLRGSDTHGVIRLPLYVRRIRAGGVNAKPNIRVVSDRPSAALIDGDNAMGHLVMRRAAHLAIEKAKATGIGWVGARMSNHAGPAALYVTMPLHHDMIGLYFAVGSNNHLPPWGGSESLLGTNPMAVAVPAQDEPADRARHGADRRGLRQGAAQGAARRADAGRLDDRPGRQAADRSEARRRRPSAADRRLQGLRAEPDHRHPRRRAQSRGAGPRRDRFRQGDRQGDQYRTGDRGDLDRHLHAAGRVQAQRRSGDPRYPQLAAAARRRAHLSAGRAEPRQAVWSAAPTACRCRRRCATASMRWRAISTSRRWNRSWRRAHPSASSASV